MRPVSHAYPAQRSFDGRVGRVAVTQHGVFSRKQIVSLGATKGVIEHRILTGRWERLAPEVYRLAGTPSSWKQRLIAACLRCGDRAVVSHRAAGALWRLPGCEQEPVELTVPRDRRCPGLGVVHRGDLPRRDVTTIESFRVTTPARTLIDLASVLPREAVEEATDDALRRGIVSPARLLRRVEDLRKSHRKGISVMRSLLQDREGAGVPQSVFETQLLRLIKRAGLPVPVLQHPIRIGRRGAVVDFAYPDLHLAIEADGYRWHSGRASWEHGLARGNALTLLGWRVIHVTWRDLTHRGSALIEDIRRAIAAAHR